MGCLMIPYLTRLHYLLGDFVIVDGIEEYTNPITKLHIGKRLYNSVAVNIRCTDFTGFT